MFNLSENYEKLWKAIIRPPRSEYNQASLGKNKFQLGGISVLRTNMTLQNKRGLRIECTHYEPEDRPCEKLPCMIYCHGNSGSRMDGYYMLSYVICHDVSFFVFDFSGCGQSQGDYISLGYYERDDVDTVFHHLRSLGTVSSIGIWGRSMGAVTALMYANQNHEIGCLVLDSPFSNLPKLCQQLAAKYAGNLSFLSGIALSFVKKTIKEKNNFDIDQIDPIGRHVAEAYIPAFFIHGKDDDFIPASHSVDLFNAYSGEKQKQFVSGGHNDRRPSELLDKVSIFISKGLRCSELIKPSEAYLLKKKEAREGKLPKISQELEGKIQIPFHSHQEYDYDEELKTAIAMSLMEPSNPPEK